MAQALTGRSLAPRMATHCSFIDSNGDAMDNGIALLFESPASFTGEDVLELQGHGSPMALALVLDRCMELGARLARPGEFSERAFLNDRMDLAQAEAVADLIDSHTRLAARAAVNALEGQFSREVHELEEAVTRLRIFVEAAIDFPDEEIDFLEEEKVVEQLEEIATLFGDLLAATAQGRILRDGIRVVLTGLPNAGKSSLLNRLAGEDRAIVSNIAGTTRDTLEQFIDIDGLAVEIIDTAGIRDTRDEIEAEGVRRARAAQRMADMVLLVVDDVETPDCELDDLVDGVVEELSRDMPVDMSLEVGRTLPVVVVHNKCDLSGRQECAENHVAVSALTGEGIPTLRQLITRRADFHPSEGSLYLARQRHIDALQRARGHLHDGLAQQRDFRAAELLADDLTACHRALGEITGQTSSDELLGKIFSSFCIGK